MRVLTGFVIFVPRGGKKQQVNLLRIKDVKGRAKEMRKLPLKREQHDQLPR